MAETCRVAPINGTIKISGQERFRPSDLVDKYLKATNDGRQVVASVDSDFH